MEEGADYRVRMIALFKGDSINGPLMQLGEPLAMIAQRDFDALWKEIGIDADSWSPDIRYQDKNFPYPQLYAIQNYIVFEHECHFDEIDDLVSETVAVKEVLRGPESKRALDVLFAVASKMASEGHGITFHPGMAS